MKFIYSKYFIYPVFFLTCIILYSSISYHLEVSNGKFRHLKDEDALAEICKKDKSLYKYYYENGDYEIHDPKLNEKDDRADTILKYLNEDFDSKYIFEYIGYQGFYIFFLILLIVIILLAIYYSIASCIRCCTEKCCNLFSCYCCKTKCCKRTICICIPIVYLIVLILSFVSLGFAVLAVDKFSGAACIGLQLVDSLVLGENKATTPKWGGISTVSEILNSLSSVTDKNNEQLAINIYNNEQNYYDKLKEWEDYLKESYNNHQDNKFSVNSPKMTNSDEEKKVDISPYYAYLWGPFENDGTILRKIYESSQNEQMNKDILYIFDNYLYSFLGCKEEDNDHLDCTTDSSMASILKKSSELVEKIKDPMDKLKEKVSEPINNVYDKVNNTVITIFSVVVSIVIFYSIIIEALLSIFCCSTKCQCNCCSCLMRWVLCLIYYTSIFIVVLGFVLGIVIGVIGSFVQDAAKVVQYITSTQNLNSTKPIIIEGDMGVYLDVCLNGDGDLAKKFGLDEEIINEITNITNDTEISNDTIYYETSPVIDYYKEYLNNLNSTSYLNIDYFDANDGSNYKLKEKLNEINKYVSGEYYDSDKQDSCMINETWRTSKEVEGYTYNEDYPEPGQTTKYLIYLYDEDFYTKAKLENRYSSACSTKNHPYETVSGASKTFGQLFKTIQTNMVGDDFEKSKEGYIKDLDKLNEIYGEKNHYLQETISSAVGVVENIGNTFISYGTSNIFSFLNCKFVGNNKLMLIDSLYTSLGVYLEAFGVTTILFSLFIFIGIVFIIIIVKNNKKDDNDGLSSVNIETLNDILTGNSSIESPGSLLDSSEQ